MRLRLIALLVARLLLARLLLAALLALVRVLRILAHYFLTWGPCPDLQRFAEPIVPPAMELGGFADPPSAQSAQNFRKSVFANRKTRARAWRSIASG